MVLARVELLPQISCIPRREERPRVENGVDGAAMRCTFLLAILPSYWLAGVGLLVAACCLWNARKA